MAKASDTPLSSAYRTVWRWHFFAGLLVLPFLMLMALTGGLYLFKREIDDAVYHRMAEVAPAVRTASPDLWLTAAERAAGGEATSVLMPDRADRAVRVGVTRADQTQRTVFVDPANARVTGVTAFGGVMETVKLLHSLVLIGSWANVIVEIVAGWAIILVATGVYLWWPRGRAVGVVSIKAPPSAGRPFWRDLHAVTGLFAGGVILFLAMTGMPWSVVWGQWLGDAVKANGLGRPPTPAAASPWAHASHGDEPAGVGWTMEGMVMPLDHPVVARLSTVIARAETEDLARPYLISIPSDPALAFTVAHQATRVENSRALYIDGAEGTVKADIGYADFGPGARAIEWGIATHQGTQYGQINRCVMLAGCVAVGLLGVSALGMWWKRRPRGRLAAPPAPPGPRAKTAVLAIVLPLAILYPLTGLSLIVAVGLDRLVAALSRPRPASA